jgi:hypothetical protein
MSRGTRRQERTGSLRRFGGGFDPGIVQILLLERSDGIGDTFLILVKAAELLGELGGWERRQLRAKEAQGVTSQPAGDRRRRDRVIDVP